MSFRAFTIFLCLAGAPGLGRAEGASDIVVTGSPLAAAKSAPAYDVISIDGARLKSSASGRLEDVLRDIGGIQQFRRSDARSAHPTSQGASVRGLGGNAASRTLVLLDGVPIADPFGGWVDWPSLDPRNLSAVRVTRGGGAGAFGSGALAGAIELESLTRDAAQALDAGAAVGQRGSFIADARTKVDMFSGFTSLSARLDRGDGFVPTIKSQRGNADQAAPYQQWSARGRYVGAISEDTEAQIALSVFGDERERGTPFSGNDSNGQDLSARFIGRGAWGWEALVFAQNRDFQSAFAAVAPDRNSATQSLDQFKTPAQGYGAKFELRPPAGENAELRLGMDYRLADGETNERFTFVNGAPTRQRKASGQNETIGGFAEYTLSPVRNLLLTATGRVDHWRIADGQLREWTIATGETIRNLKGANRDDWETLGRIGASYALSPMFSVRAAAYQSYRLPTLNELYRPFRAGADGTAANLNLEPEKLHGAELGTEVSLTDNVKVGATFFWNKLDDAIANVSVAKLPGDICPGVGFVSGACRARKNLDGIESKGVEIDASFVHGDWTISGSYNYADAKVQGAQLDGLRPAQTPRHQGSVIIAWGAQEGVQAALTGRYVSGQFEDDQNARRLASAATLDGFAAFPLRDGLRLELRGENLTDARVEAGRSGLGIIERATPRTLWVALRYSN